MRNQMIVVLINKRNTYPCRNDKKHRSLTLICRLCAEEKDKKESNLSFSPNDYHR